ncbi:MAG: hypothetical protein LBV08_07220, partial [Clostridiales bacterium]|nr:hypothetical protein [Clostridiales bacterium]
MKDLTKLSGTLLISVLLFTGSFLDISVVAKAESNITGAAEQENGDPKTSEDIILDNDPVAEEDDIADNTEQEGEGPETAEDITSGSGPETTDDITSDSGPEEDTEKDTEEDTVYGPETGEQYYISFSGIDETLHIYIAEITKDLMGEDIHSSDEAWQIFLAERNSRIASLIMEGVSAEDETGQAVEASLKSDGGLFEIFGGPEEYLLTYSAIHPETGAEFNAERKIVLHFEEALLMTGEFTAPVKVTSFPELLSAIGSAPKNASGEYYIEIMNPFDFQATSLLIDEAKKITLFSNNSGGFILTQPNSNYRHFYLSGSGTSFTLSKGVTLSSTGAATYSGGVSAVGGAKFILDGGKIIGNSGSNSTSINGNPLIPSWKSALGGGVFIFDAYFDLINGEISGNRAIGDGTTIKTGYGGGVFIAGISEFNMTGGKISDNYSLFGGGVGINNTYDRASDDMVTFNMSGGEISSNRTAEEV